MDIRDFRKTLGIVLVGGVVISPAIGCSGSDEAPSGSVLDAGTDTFLQPEDAIRIHGSVVDSAGGMGASVPVAGAEVRLSVDRNGDGILSPDEVSTVSTGFDGSFDLNVRVEDGQTVVARFRSPGSATAFRTIVAAPKSEVELTVSLTKLVDLTCAGGRCALAGNLLSVEGLDPGVRGAAQIFNPVTQADRFPGGFQESTGRLLISGVFSTVELTDEAGDPVTVLNEPATLRMNVPMDTWGIMTDIRPGTDRIEVPLYAFDEALGTWVRDGEAYLEDGDGGVIPESDLPSIRDGSYPGIVVSRGEVDHFSYWNVDWPVESHGCVSGRIVDDNGNPVQGALVAARGITYTGSSTPVTVGSDGRFCITVMRSEAPAEDIDQNGIPGQIHSVSLRVTHGGKVYSGGIIDVAVAPATCDQGGCTDVGDVGLTPDNHVPVTMCTVSGTVRDRKGAPVADATVTGWDDSVNIEIILGMCGSMFENCQTSDTGPDGKYTVSGVMLDGMTVFAMTEYYVESGREAVRQGQRLVAECPTEPVDITLDQGYDFVDLWVQVDGDQISWDPNEPAMVLSVMDAWEEASKWYVLGLEGGFTGPVAYGTVPGNAMALPSGAPPPMASGDVVTVMITGTTPDGYAIYGEGEAWVP